MVRKLALMLATAAAVGGAAFIPTVASASEYGHSYRHGSHVRSDVRDIRRDRADLRRDRREVRRNLRTGHYGSAERELRDIQRDRRDLHRDKADVRRDLHRRGY